MEIKCKYCNRKGMKPIVFGEFVSETLWGVPHKLLAYTCPNCHTITPPVELDGYLADELAENYAVNGIIEKRIKPLTIEEIKERLDDNTNETIGLNCLIEEPGEIPLTHAILDEKTYGIVATWNGDALSNYLEQDYNITWRAWDSMPTYEDRLANDWRIL